MMKRNEFFDERVPSNLFVIRSCSEFMNFCENIALKDRAFFFGRPYKKAFVTKLFQNPWLGKINPFWVRHYQCWGPKITIDKARELYRSQAPIPLDQRPSQDQDTRLVKLSRLVEKPRKTVGKHEISRREPYVPSFSRNGDAQYGGDYPPYFALHENPHLVSYRTVYVHSSVNTPNFRHLKKRDRPWNPYAHTFFRGKEEFGGWSDNYKDGTRQGASGYIRGMTATGLRIVDTYQYFQAFPDDAKAKSLALGKALDRSKAMSVNLAQAYAERKQTVSLMTSSVMRLVYLAMALKQGNLKGARELISGNVGPQVAGRKATAIWNSTGTHVVGRRYTNVIRPEKSNFSADLLPNLWLEYKYGWQPLLSDIYGSAEKLANTYHLPKRVRVSGKAEDAQKFEVAQTSLYDRNFVSRNVRSRVVFEFEEATDVSNVFSSTGISNPALLAWELVPYSFVVDWFVPIGSYLSRLDATVGLNFKRGATTTVKEILFESDLNRTVPGTVRTNTGSKMSHEAISKVREVYFTAPLPMAPRFDPNLGVEKFLSAASLLTQLFTKGKTTVKL